MHKIKYHLSKAQQNLVDKISKYYKVYTTAKVKETNAVVIKAPTAAGKTVLIANIANHIAKEDKQAVFIVVTIPKNTLHLAAKSSITDSIEKFGLSYLDNPITVDKNTDIDKVLKRVLHPELGKASCITTADNYFNELNKCKINYDVFSDLLDKLKEHGKSIYCFVDEAHYNFQKAQALLSSNSNLIFYVSATPDTLANQYKLSDSKNYFEITKQEALDDNLLVGAIDNTDFDDVLIGNSSLVEERECAAFSKDNLLVVDDKVETNVYKVIKPKFVSCLDTFVKSLKVVNSNYNKVAKTFKESGIKSIPDKINICGMIQISNKAKGVNEYRVIKTFLEARYPRLKYVYVDFNKVIYSDNFLEKHKELKTMTDKEKRETVMQYIKDNDSDIDIIIFKQMFVEGTDIPRCHVLMQIRDTVSPTLTIQFKGRGLRNPFFVALQELDSSFLEDSKKSDLLQLFKDNCKTVFFGFPESVSDSHTLHVSVAKDISLPSYNFDIKPYMTLADKEAVYNAFNDKDITCYRQREIDYKHGSDFLTSDDVYASDVEKFRDLLKEAINERKIVYADACIKLPSILNSVENMELNLKSVTKNVEDSIMPKTTIEEHGYFAELEGTPVQINVNEIKNLKNTDTYKVSNTKKQKFTENTVVLDSKAELDFVKILNEVIKTKKIKKQGNYNIVFKNPVYAHKYAISFPLDFKQVKKYPDFVFVDTNDRLHIIEVKSYNTSNTQNLDAEEYKKKTEKLKEVFKSLCKVDGISTKFYFDVAIQQGKKWTISQSYNGETKVFDSSKKWVDWLAENA